MHIHEYEKQMQSIEINSNKRYIYCNNKILVENYIRLKINTFRNILTKHFSLIFIHRIYYQNLYANLLDNL